MLISDNPTPKEGVYKASSFSFRIFYKGYNRTTTKGIFMERSEEILQEALDMLPAMAESTFDSGNYNLDDDEDLYIFTADLFEAMAKVLRQKYQSNTRRN